MAIVLVTAICILGVAFLIRFLIALCEEDASRSQQSVYIVPASAGCEIDPLSLGVFRVVPRAAGNGQETPGTARNRR